MTKRAHQTKHKLTSSCFVFHRIVCDVRPFHLARLKKLSSPEGPRVLISEEAKTFSEQTISKPEDCF